MALQGGICVATNQVHRPKVKREKIQVPKCIRSIDKTRQLTVVEQPNRFTGPKSNGSKFKYRSV